jgi:hypothetical protein
VYCICRQNSTFGNIVIHFTKYVSTRGEGVKFFLDDKLPPPPLAMALFLCNNLQLRIQYSAIIDTVYFGLLYSFWCLAGFDLSGEVRILRQLSLNM